MVANILYAYLENVQWISVIAVILLLSFMILLAIVRMKNDVDRDDWQLLMQWTVPLAIFFLLLTMLPGMEHIKDVKKKFTDIDVEEVKPRETQNETIYYPSSSCNSVLMCR